MTIDQIRIPSDIRFQTQEASIPDLEAICSQHRDLASFETIGVSEEGRPIVGMKVGVGPEAISLVAGAHSDEPVGPETLRFLASELLNNRSKYKSYLNAYTFLIIPHVNPDGEALNQPWIQEWPSLEAYIRHAYREKPGRDVEFSYPKRRLENEVVSSWLKSHGPFSMHMSLHGMGFSDGAMLLIERNWTYRTEKLQAGFAEAARGAGLRLHDHNRKGEKGFFNIAPGYTTTPEGAAMRTYFMSHDDPETAALFGDSSMEYVRSLGGDPLCLVTELPLFLVEGDASPGIPTAYLEFKQALPEFRLTVAESGNLDGARARFGLSHLPIDVAIRLQLTALDLGLATIAD